MNVYLLTKAFTTSQINTFSVSQAQSTTADQRSALDSSQMAALTDVANTTFADTQSGGKYKQW